MSDITIALILIGAAIFAAGFVSARILSERRRTRDRLRKALRDAVERGGRNG